MFKINEKDQEYWKLKDMQEKESIMGVQCIKKNWSLGILV